MAKKAQTKRAFDWRTYSKPARLLTSAQEEAFGGGMLAPLLEWAAADARTRVEIRSRQAAFYHRGVSLARVQGDGPHLAEFEAAAGSAPERVEIASAEDVAELERRLEHTRSECDRSLDSGDTARNHRGFASAIAQGNRGDDLWADALIVADADYSLGRRKLDLVALLRTEGVTGPGGFANPDLAFIDVRVPGQSLTGPAGLAAVADDLADFCKALSGDHLRHTEAEIGELVAQKVRLGLLPAELEVRGISQGMPHLIIAFAESDPRPPACDAAIVELHDRLAARHFPTHRLRFLHFTQVPEDGDGLALEPGDAAGYREFKAYRYEGR